MPFEDLNEITIDRTTFRKDDLIKGKAAADKLVETQQNEDAELLKKKVWIGIGVCDRWECGKEIEGKDVKRCARVSPLSYVVWRSRSLTPTNGSVKQRGIAQRRFVLHF